MSITTENNVYFIVKFQVLNKKQKNTHSKALSIEVKRTMYVNKNIYSP